MRKTRTLELVIQPLPEAFFGSASYGASAQSNHAAQNFGPRSRILHSANGLLFYDSLVAARLKLTAQTQKKLDHRRSPLAKDVVVEAVQLAASCCTQMPCGQFTPEHNVAI